ncbi:hypothetical protein LCGC14_2529790 [marine sediment metagenome]|uniref:Uncharacterized protein n=1 Tax=marine sediment metagenome TaxID=412755 RepID=A0A0F9AUB6_9ZZZZ
MKFKVYGGMSFHKGKQVRAIVATKTKKKARELFDISYSYFTDYFGETGNEKELEIALANPEIVFCTAIQGSENYIILES